MERIIITFEQDGAFRGASVTDFDGLPKPLDQSGLSDIFPAINEAALARVATLEEELAAITPEKESLQTELDTALARIAELEAVPDDTTISGVSKLTIMRRLGDKWPTLKAALSSLPEVVQDAWSLAQEIRADDPLFIQYGPQLKQLLGLTDDQFDSLLTYEEIV